ncbi:MAG TPA: hydrogenase maturation protease [Sulfurimonas autotrophica]|nr:hydrogenase maturation protease [Sulfurimonas autotrophica]
MKEKRVALIGIGNIMFHDEGMGTYLVNYIKENYEEHPSLTVVEGGTLGFGLMTYYQEYDKIIVVGTGSKNDKVGTISSENAQEIISNESVTRKTANEVEITMMIEICSFHENMGDVQLLTMVPSDIIEVKNGMTSETLLHMPKFVEATLKELKSSGIELQKKKKTVSFEEIIHICANPKVSHYNDMSNLK